MWVWWKFDSNNIAGADVASGQDDAHNPGTADFLTCGVALTPEVLLETGAEVVDFAAWSAQAGDFNNGVSAEMQAGSKRKCEHVQTTSEDVFAEFAGSDG